MTDNSPSLDEKTAEPRLWVFGRPWTRWRTVRLLLILNWLVALFLWAVTSMSAASCAAEIITMVVVPVFLWPWLKRPYVLYTRGWLPLRATYAVQNQADGGFDFARHDENVLYDLGFERAGYLTKESRPGCKVQVALYVHFGNMDTAYIGQLQTGFGPIRMCAFESRFKDDFVFESSNTRSAQLFGQDPNNPVFRFPQLRSRRDLYRIHQKLKERFATTRVPTVGEKPEELERFIARAEVTHQKIAKTSYKLSKEGDRYVHTVRGAIRLSWLLTWPVKDVRQLIAESKAMKTADLLGLPINPKFGRLVNSVSAEQSRQQHP